MAGAARELGVRVTNQELSPKREKLEIRTPKFEMQGGWGRRGLHSHAETQRSQSLKSVCRIVEGDDATRERSAQEEAGSGGRKADT
jgi:hypothetical protein